MDCSVMDHHRLTFGDMKKGGNVPNVRSMSKIPQLSKIPAPVGVSRIPLRGSKPKKNLSPKVTVLGHKPKMRTAILKPIITKRNSIIPFKEFNLSKAGAKPVVKRKSIGKAKFQKPLQRSANIPFAGKFIKEKRKENIGASSEKNVSKSNAVSLRDFKPYVKNEKKTLREMQEELNAAFEPSEFYKNQILNNKEITMKQLGYITPLKDKRNSRDPAEVALERIQRWSSSKKAKTSIEKENFCSSPKMRPRFSGAKDSKSYDSMIRRSTWAPGSSPARAQPKIDAYEAAMARIKHMSISKAQSPFVQKLKDGQGSTVALRSPVKMTPYDIAMQQLSSLKKASKVTNPVPEARKLDTKEEVDERMDEMAHVKNNLEIAFANLSPKNAFKARPGSIYRPLHNLQTLTLSPARPIIQKHRLTDISEHSENENSTTLSQVSLGFGRFSRSSVSEPSTRDNTPQLTLDGPSFSSFKAPIVRSSADQSCQNIQSTPCLAQPTSRSSILNATVTPSMSRIHMPVPVSAYTSKLVQSPVRFFESDEMSHIDTDSAPIQTPLLLKRMAKISEAEIGAIDDGDLGSVKQSLNFLQEDFSSSVKDLESKWEPRYSNYVKHIPTKVKMEEMLADQEVEFIMSRQLSMFSQTRVTPINPLAIILSKGDHMHFVPVMKEVPAR